MKISNFSFVIDEKKKVHRLLRHTLSPTSPDLTMKHIRLFFALLLAPNLLLLSCRQQETSRLEQAHYAYLASQVERLRPYYNYSQTEYDNLALSISDKLEEYKNHARSVYGKASNISDLESRAGNYYSNASFD